MTPGVSMLGGWDGSHDQNTYDSDETHRKNEAVERQYRFRKSSLGRGI